MTNGNYDISAGDCFGITSTAGFQNTFGMYFKDANGDLIAFANV